MKDTVLKHCAQFVNVDIRYIEDCVENKRLIEENNYRNLNGCPQSFGLDDYVGLCEIEENENVSQSKLLDLCEMCWKTALSK